MSSQSRVRWSFVLVLVVLCIPVHSTAQSADRTPVVFFPGWHLTKLLVKVENQTVTPDCPSSGEFQDWIFNNTPDGGFSQVCRDKLLTMVYDSDPSKLMPERFLDQAGVTVELLDYGKTESAPFYEDLYVALESAGYTRNKNIRVAGYDARLTPDMGGFLTRTISLIEETYHDNGDTPVHLIGHSNGPLYTQYLLTHTSQAWKNKFIHGFTPVAGNFPGQGGVYLLCFTGFNVTDLSLPADLANARSSATMYLSHPSTYMSASDPKIFGKQEVVVSDLSTGKSYTPQDDLDLFRDAGLPQARDIAAYYIGFVEFASPGWFPYLDVYAEKGSRVPTVVGVQLPNLAVGQVTDDTTVFYTRDGDGNQEDLTNEAVQAWSAMPYFRFSLTDNPGIEHLSLTGNPDVTKRLLMHLQLPRTPP